MGDLNKALQIITVILLQQLLNVLSVLWRLTLLLEQGEVAIPNRTVIRMPSVFKKLRLIKLIPPAVEIQHRYILIHEGITSLR